MRQPFIFTHIAPPCLSSWSYVEYKGQGPSAPPPGYDFSLDSAEQTGGTGDQTTAGGCGFGGIKRQIVMTHTKASSPKHPTWKRPAKIAGIVILIFLSLYAIGEGIARYRFSVVYSEMERLRREVIDPAGGVENVFKHDNGESPDFGGQDFIGTGCSIDVACPYVWRQWFVPFDKDPAEQSTFLKTAFQGYESYSNTTIDEKVADFKLLGHVYITGEKDDLSIGIDLGPISHHYQPPSAAPPEGKQWMSVIIHLEGRQSLGHPLQ